MHDHANIPNPDAAREEILINRVVDAEATAADWAELDAFAQSDAGVWARLAEAQRSQNALQRAVDDALTVAELVDLPDPRAEFERSWSDRVRVWGGWLAAAVIVLAWAGNFAQGTRQQAPGASNAGLVAANALTPDQLLQMYLTQGREGGRVVGEMPMVMLETMRTQDGRSEITFVRPLVERMIVDNFYELGQNDAGQVVPVPVNWRASSAVEGEPL
ncbi:MAG: hypothetical protein KF684_06870 [Phycisphaeraceae bacterium]|nr:hypothetical protein [Phycisphaeraceae bacterium]